MAKSTNVDLSGDVAEFVNSQVQAGRYDSASEMIQSGLKLLQDEETRIATLRMALQEGEQSGNPAPFDVDAFVQSQKSSQHD